MKAIAIVTNSDEVGGTTIFSDGTKMFWTEGRSSRVVILDARGEWHVERAAAPFESKWADYIEAQPDDATAVREMTWMEEMEHAWAREQSTTSLKGQFFWMRLAAQQGPEA